MVFSSTVSGETVFGNKRVKYGSFASGTYTGGDIVTGLNTVEVFNVICNGSLATSVVPNETLPLAGGSVTVICSANSAGYWEAKGN
jgi:hypothetical protein